jgi:hypothetical protein
MRDVSAFVGSDACRAELTGHGPGFGLALDRRNRTSLEMRDLNGKPTLLLIQYKSDSDHCGTVRDIVVAPEVKDVFEFECIDRTDAKRIVVGVHQGIGGAREWKASKAWTIDFETLKLMPTKDAVVCLNYDYSGADDGTDIRSRAIARANRKNP